MVQNEEVGTLLAQVQGLQAQLRQQRSELDAVHLKAHAAEMRVRRLSAALMGAQELERTRIAAELQNSVAQALLMLNFDVDGAIELARNGDTLNATEKLQALRPQVRGTLDEVKRIALDLRPTMLDDLGIVGTLAWFSREFRAAYADICLRTEIDLQERDLAVALRTPIYRVVQQALDNVVKHARATQVSLHLRRESSATVLEICDNGAGFAPSEGTEKSLDLGLGLTGMRDRVESSGGRFRLNSAVGAGTRVEACWPLSSRNWEARAHARMAA